MIDLVMAVTMAASSPSAAVSAEKEPKKDPVRYCRAVIEGVSRSSDFLICRTKKDWSLRDSCNSATRYCTPEQKKLKYGRTAAFAMSEDSRIICRVLAATGSRLQSQRICLPQREWQRMWDDSSHGVSKLQDQSTRARVLGEQ